MKADNVHRKGDTWLADCPDCGWRVCLQNKDAERSGAGFGQSPEEYFRHLVSTKTCMCVPHEFEFGDPIDGFGYVSSVKRDVTPSQIQITGKQPDMGIEVTLGGGKRFRVSSRLGVGWYTLEEIGVLRGPRAKAKKYPGECPCGISARMCDYHKDL